MQHSHQIHTYPWAGQRQRHFHVIDFSNAWVWVHLHHAKNNMQHQWKHFMCPSEHVPAWTSQKTEEQLSPLQQCQAEIEEWQTVTENLSLSMQSAVTDCAKQQNKTNCSKSSIGNKLQPPIIWLFLSSDPAAQCIDFVPNLFGHCAKETVTNTAKHHDFSSLWRLKLHWNLFHAANDATQNDLTKETYIEATKLGQHFYIGSASVKETDLGGCNWNTQWLFRLHIRCALLLQLLHFREKN